ncbi:unnamed protein product [Lactuca virosa]|uniref:Uncharacterized protein n=1 Tax=Lactuca virosa TaxID=75947 RepID=A0AAU9MIM2_9ASTR|nr:unnamed protein product [Lactuca virosa]
MSIANIVVDQFNTTEHGVSLPNIKIQSNNVWFNPSIEDYPKELKMVVHCINNSILTHALMTFFAILMKRLSLVGSTVMFNKTTEIITFQMESKRNKRLNKKQFAQILQLPTKM